MSRVLVIGLNTFRENLREELLYNLVIFALLIIGSSILLQRLSLGETSRLILDLALAAINIFGVLIAVVVVLVISVARGRPKRPPPEAPQSCPDPPADRRRSRAPSLAAPLL